MLFAKLGSLPAVCWLAAVAAWSHGVSWRSDGGGMCQNVAPVRMPESGPLSAQRVLHMVIFSMRSLRLQQFPLLTDCTTASPLSAPLLSSLPAER